MDDEPAIKQVKETGKAKKNTKLWRASGRSRLRRIDSQRYLCQYRFARPYLHHVWAKYPRDETQRRLWSSQLAEALERLTHPLTYLVTDKLHRCLKWPVCRNALSLTAAVGHQAFFGSTTVAGAPLDGDHPERRSVWDVSLV